jgi:uncharacterized damage-inducible protein DinB
MADFTDEDLSGSTFTRVDLTSARFEQVELRGAFLRNIYLTGARLRGGWLEDVDVDGEIRGLRVNGVDVGPLVEAELDRRFPERQLLHPTTADGFRQAWAAVSAGWEPTIERARHLPEAALHERVDHEWSFLETLRHLVFCVDAWLLRAVLGEPSPYWPAGLAHDEIGQDTPVPIDPHADPYLEEVLAVRAGRRARVEDFLMTLTDEQLAGTTTPVGTPGYPAGITYAVARCLGAVVREEFLHRTFAERDLAVLEARADRHVLHNETASAPAGVNAASTVASNPPQIRARSESVRATGNNRSAASKTRPASAPIHGTATATRDTPSRRPVDTSTTAFPSGATAARRASTAAVINGP